ncbi:hypothetical protein [Austwickia chelonae]|uniref:hypothetical protein n=1 Tax=Austwickia chelonae TaxID=100225 RepID=UPI000E2351F6|nr:hypothetical protein [Austwickia chelonae]
MASLTTTEAAELTGVKTAVFRGLVIYARKDGIELESPRDTWPNPHTPLYDEERLRSWLAARARPDKARAS